MSYTLEQKREAANRDELWWRFPNELGAGDRKWTLCGICISADEAEYHIGPTPPRVLSELEGELLDVAHSVMTWWGTHQYDTWTDSDGDEHNTFGTEPLMVTKARAAIQKAEAQQ